MLKDYSLKQVLSMEAARQSTRPMTSSKPAVFAERTTPLRTETERDRKGVEGVHECKIPSIID